MRKAPYVHPAARLAGFVAVPGCSGVGATSTVEASRSAGELVCVSRRHFWGFISGERASRSLAFGLLTCASIRSGVVNAAAGREGRSAGKEICWGEGGCSAYCRGGFGSSVGRSWGREHHHHTTPPASGNNIEFVFFLNPVDIDVRFDWLIAPLRLFSGEEMNEMVIDRLT